MKALVLLIGYLSLAYAFDCPDWLRAGKKPPTSCVQPTDPQNRAPSKLESWFTEAMFNDLFPKANLGHGPSNCRPYNYKAFVIAARYFPKFGTEYVSIDPEGNSLRTTYTQQETFKRDLAAFFAHAIQETGENNGHLYQVLPKEKAHDCFYRGGFYNWFEGGPFSPFVKNQGLDPKDGEFCVPAARYCDEGSNTNWFYPCAKGTSGGYHRGCYFGRGAIQISYNYNYGLFNRWLIDEGIMHNGEPVDILENPNLVMTKMDPPLSILASMWFYMTPQSPKPSMHDIVIGNWVSPDPEFGGGVFGPTSLVINNECGGEDIREPGGAGESRRIKAFKWFCKYFGVRHIIGSEKTLSCKVFNGGIRKFTFPDGRKVGNSWDADWRTSWDPSKPCRCAMQTYQGYIPAFDPAVMPHLSDMNERHKKWCEELYQAGWRKQGCANYKGN
ncbi:uncharacterized protein LOC135694545 [Rhopilema esculentum]|uniref:uncharacterized protein LOC135694545 n=1 Tax=Rhopilema esculentum TaxID=499914 RepID=UPI0031D3FA1A|eukprot:gene4386-20608_t